MLPGERDESPVVSDGPTGQGGGSLLFLPERRLQDAEEARELRHHQTLDGAVVGSQSEEVPHQRLHLRTRPDREDCDRRTAAQYVTVDSVFLPTLALAAQFWELTPPSSSSCSGGNSTSSLVLISCRQRGQRACS